MIIVLSFALERRCKGITKNAAKQMLTAFRNCVELKFRKIREFCVIARNCAELILYGFVEVTYLYFRKFRSSYGNFPKYAHIAAKIVAAGRLAVLR